MEEATARKLLQDERERLVATREGVQGELDDAQSDEASRSGYLTQPADQVSQLNVREEDASLITHLEQGIREVDQALQRLDEGTYGRCEVDGEPIPDERLEALPATRFCVAHEQELEHQEEAERTPDRAGPGSTLRGAP